MGAFLRTVSTLHAEPAWPESESATVCCICVSEPALILAQLMRFLSPRHLAPARLPCDETALLRRAAA